MSVDGPAERNGDRVTRAGRAGVRPDHAGASQRCAGTGMPFAALCVVSDPRPGLAAELYDYFLELGCDVLGINIEEQEGVNERDNRHDRGRRARLLGRAGRGLAPATRGSTCARSSGRCGTSAAVLDGTADELLPRQLDPIPTVGARRLGGAALARAGRLHPIPGTATSAAATC